MILSKSSAYRCSSVTKRDSSFCGTRQVSSDRLDSCVIEGLDKIAHNQQYLDSLIFTLNYGQQGSQQGIEPEGSTSGYTAERAREIIQTITNAYKLPGKNDKELIIKKHIRQVNYSKETIEVEINYPDQTRTGTTRRFIKSDGSLGKVGSPYGNRTRAASLKS